MNVRLRKEFVFHSGIVYQDQYMINQYHTVIDMLTSTEHAHEQNTAYDRMRFWIHEVLHNSVMMNRDHPKLSAYAETGQRVITLPDEPLDQIVGIMLCCKLNAITENRMIITDVELKSSCGEDMVYLHSVDENIGPFAADGWWNDARPKCANYGQGQGSNIITITRAPEWKDVGLDWHQEDQPSSTVVFADFKKDHETE